MSDLRAKAEPNTILAVVLHEDMTTSTHIKHTDGLNDPAFWGLVLADCAHHIANMWAAEFKQNREDVMQRMLSVFKKEIRQPSTQHAKETPQ